MSLSEKEQIKVLEKRILRLERAMKRGMMLFYPEGDYWVPAQGDKDGRMVIDPTDLDTRYHKKDEDIDVGEHGVIIGTPGSTGARLAPFGYEYQALRIDKGSYSGIADLRDLYVGSFRTRTGLIGLSSKLYIDTRKTASSDQLIIRTWDGSARKTVAQAVDDHIAIPRAGNITMLPLKTLTVDPSGEIIVPYDAIDLAVWPAVTGLANGSNLVVHNADPDDARLYIAAGGKTNAYYIDLTPG